MDSAKKGINLDLDTEALKRHYTKGDWHKAYYEVRNHFEKTDLNTYKGPGIIPLCRCQKPVQWR